MARIRDCVIPSYESLPNGSGAFAADMMRLDLDRAARAIMEGDVVEMLEVYQGLKETKPGMDEVVDFGAHMRGGV